ncbi:PLP-dependent aminotransferase family protein [Geodermatophilus sp. DSM 44513]|uniref:MocR-like pyridoxine biosynthesis transcription factor PdxR n=1 Tax=Geodermatophilus sp. DSM 44513 TaxID=1528104 RepID=UPI001288494B|nr:PLP-dependent aminotransferase family protein [Geodermatophilus sp. DSM 44513]WNV73964.1 PLP-dependent aminotransferase family protein [Geodermatophilus sp. DSM 44513]
MDSGEVDHLRSPTRRGELLVEVSRAGGEPVREQLRRQLIAAMDAGRLTPGDRLPPSRHLAADLCLARGTVVEVYDQLQHEGYLETRRGSGTLVAGRPPGSPAGEGPPTTWVPAVPEDAPLLDLRPGAPDLAAFPRAAWSSATAHVLRVLPDRELGYVPPWGSVALRTQLAGHLARTRVTAAGPDDVVVTSGVTQALTLTCRVLTDLGHRALAVEDPSNAIQRRVLGRHVPAVVDVPVDDEGLDVAALERSGARAVLVTPAHQHPTGVVLSPRRRAALLAWADRVDGWVLEDDYDAEFRFGRQSAPSLQGAAPGRVVHVGSVSKTLAPGLRLGWLLAPPALRAALVGAKRDDDFGTSVLTQHTLAHLLDTGAHDRHLRRLRLRYRGQRRALVEALARHLPAWRVQGAEAGLHLCAMGPADVDEVAVVDAAAERGLLVLDLGRMRSAPGAPGLVLGFARVREHQADVAVRRLRDAVAAAAARPRAGATPRTTALPDPRSAVRLGTTALDYFPPGSTGP